MNSSCIVRSALCFFCIVTLFPTTSHASNMALTVSAKGSGVPLAKVEIRCGDKTFFTDSKGEVKIDCPDSSKITLSKRGYEKADISIQDLKKEGEDLVIYLLPALTGDDEIIVQGQRRPEISRKVVTIQEAQKVAPGGDPVQITKLMPGVQTLAFQPQIVVRGSAPADTKYFIDDLEVPLIFHTIGNISIVPEAIIDDISFSAGGFGARYGDAMGGIISIKTKTEVAERPLTTFSVNIPIYSSLSHTHPIGEDQNVSITVRRSYLELFLPRLLKNQSDLTLSPYFGDVNAVYTQKFQDGHHKVTALWTFDGIKAVFPNSASNSPDGEATFDDYQGFYVLGLERFKRLNNSWRYVTTPQVQRMTQTANILDNSINLVVTTVQMPTEFTKRLSKDEQLSLGANFTYGVADADIVAPVPPAKDPFYDIETAPKISTTDREQGSLASAWAEIDQHLGSVLVTPGLRGFYNSTIRKTSVDPRISSRYPLDAANTLKASVGQYSEAPDPQQTSHSFGNPNLDFQRSIQYIIGVETKWSDRWNTDIQGYYKREFRLVRSDPDTLYNNDGSMHSTGVEFFLRRDLTERLFAWVDYTYSVSQERDSDEESFHPAQYDQTHVLNLVANYKLTALWDIGGHGTYHTGDRLADFIFQAFPLMF